MRAFLGCTFVGFLLVALTEFGIPAVVFFLAFPVLISGSATLILWWMLKGRHGMNISNRRVLHEL